MSQYLIERIDQSANIEVLPHTEVAQVAGGSGLESLTLRNNRTGAEETRPAHCLFVFIGAEPRTDWLGTAVLRDARGYIVTGRDLQGGERRGVWPLERDPFITETSVPGVFAAGDVRCGSVKRVAAAVGEGSITVSFVHAHLETL
jgi:thioredoxin reductase (NADPH)